MNRLMDELYFIVDQFYFREANNSWVAFYEESAIRQEHLQSLCYFI